MKDEGMLRISGIVGDSIVDGPGLRMSIFTQGCPHHCPGCHNPDTHDPAGGRWISREEILGQLRGNPLQAGVTLSGGEPFEQAEALIPLCREIRRMGKNIWIYSGYTFEQLLEGAVPFGQELMGLCDVLVDGRFILAERDLTLLFRGSRNQRVVDLPASLSEEKAVLLSLED